MEWVETTGRTIEEAKEAALDELGVDEQDAEFEVIDEPKVGLFGRLRAEGRIRARVRPTTPRAKEDRRDRRRRTKPRRRRRRGGAPPAADEPAADGRPGPGGHAAAKADTTGDREGAAPRPPEDPAHRCGPGRPRTNPSRRRGRPGPGPAAAGRPAPRSVIRTTPAAAGDPGARRDRRGRGPAPARSRSRKRTPAGRTPAASSDDGIDAGEGTLMDVPLDEQGKVAEQFLVGLLDSFGLSAQIAVTVPDEDTIDIQVTGDDLGLLIGPKGATLLSIQDLTRTVVQRKTSAGNGRIFIDVSGYRQKRNEALSRFAQKVAADVLSSGTRVALEPMSAPDRKTVHDAITEIDGVTPSRRARTPCAMSSSCRRRLSGPTGPSRCRSRLGPLTGVLERARQLGFLGPGPVDDHLAQPGLRGGLVVGPAPPRHRPRPRQRRRRPRPGARLRLAGSRRCAPRRQRPAGRLPAGRHRRPSASPAGDHLAQRAEEAGHSTWRSAYDLVTARGFGPPAVTAECGGALLAPGGILAVAEPPGSDPARWPARPWPSSASRPPDS